MTKLTRDILFIVALCALLAASVSFNCGKKRNAEEGSLDSAQIAADSAMADSLKAAQEKLKKKTPFAHITSEKKFEHIFKTSGDTLLVFDLYADWCMPCKILEPTLKEIAKEYPKRANYYKINIDMLPSVARAFRAFSIPLIVFVKNKKIVASLPGVRPKAAYVGPIKKYGLKKPQPKKHADSTLEVSQK